MLLRKWESPPPSTHHFCTKISCSSTAIKYQKAYMLLDYSVNFCNRIYNIPATANRFNQSNKNNRAKLKIWDGAKNKARQLLFICQLHISPSKYFFRQTVESLLCIHSYVHSSLKIKTLLQNAVQ